MPDWGWDLVRSFVGAGFGTAAMTAAISIWRDRGQRRSEAVYLALRLAVAFERYAAECADLIAENENAWAPPDEELPNWTTSLPDLAPYPSDSDGWKALAADLAADSLNLPNRIREGQFAISETAEHHPEGTDRIVAIQASECGLQAWSLACQLRDRYRIKVVEPAYDYVGQLKRTMRHLER